MSTLYLIRHARASASEADYDQLHAEGAVQARLLGEHFGLTRQQFDAVFVGPHLRHQETLRIACAAAGAVGARWPSPITIEGLAEAPYDVLVKRYLMPRVSSDPTLAQLAQQLGDRQDDARRETIMRAIWDHMTVLWRERQIVGDDLETAQTFEARVRSSLAQMLARIRHGEHVLVMTSIGVIDHLVSAQARAVPDGGEVTHKFYNTSVTILDVSGRDISLRTKNQVTHLADKALWTLL